MAREINLNDKKISWMKQHPILTTAIIIGLITAGVFTGAIFIIPPAALVVMSSIAVWGFIALAVGCLLKRAGVNNPYQDATSGQRDDLIEADASDGADARSSWAASSLLCVAGALLSIVFPPVGVFFCGVFATLASSGLAAGGVALGINLTADDSKKPAQPSTTNSSYQMMLKDTSSAVASSAPERRIEEPVHTASLYQAPDEVVNGDTSTATSDSSTYLPTIV